MTTRFGGVGGKEISGKVFEGFKVLRKESREMAPKPKGSIKESLFIQEKIRAEEKYSFLVLLSGSTDQLLC